jgi:hypothetical protein
MKTFKEFWSDPVWSKVIAAGITAVFGALILGCYSLITTKPFFDLLFQLLHLKVELWIVVSAVILVSFFYFIFRTKKKSLVTASSNNIIVLVDLANSSEFNIETEQAKVWIDNKEVGEQSVGKLDIKDGVLNLKRTNKDGRFIIRILEYNNNNITGKFIKSNINLEGDRRILVSFKAKIIGGSHSIRVVCTKKDSHLWVHKANFKFVIESKEYQDFNQILKVPANEDFNIRMEDIEVENPQSSIQIRDFMVKELY